MMKSWLAILPGSLVLASLLLAPLSRAQAEPSGTWLDETMNWNEAGAAIPQAPEQGGSNLTECEQTVRQAVLPEDDLVMAAGWTLTGAAQIYGDTTVIMGMANADGMCRPLAYQGFVFTAGEFSGTVSPWPMDSRIDGGLLNLILYGEGYLDASFERDASGQSRLFYQVETESGSPVLVPDLPADTLRPLGLEDIPAGSPPTFPGPPLE
ncbi:MAG: LppP/LprE family lipoprotein [Cyanobacteria bacterium P01_D01_bin.115]